MDKQQTGDSQWERDGEAAARRTRTICECGHRFEEHNITECEIEGCDCHTAWARAIVAPNAEP